jgi:hypothetical protein
MTGVVALSIESQSLCMVRIKRIGTVSDRHTNAPGNVSTMVKALHASEETAAAK